MQRLLRERESEILAALHADLGKPAIEAWSIDIAVVLSEIDELLKHLSDWTAPKRVQVPLTHLPASAAIVHEPLGVVLVIAPWNNPVHLLIVPMAGAIAAGNAVVGKPSEITPHTSATLARLAHDYLDEEAIILVEGGASETQALLEQHFDHIFFTGGSNVGRIVMAAAAKQLTPVTLELGGKNPAIVDRDADLEVTARRITWGKFINAGQTCIAPDYVLVHAAVQDELVALIAKAIRNFYGTNPRNNPDYGRIVSDQHFARVTALLDGSKATVVVGGDRDASARYIAPTLLRDVATDAAVMTEETFGPVLPVVAVRDVDEAIAFVNSRPKPLVLYLFAAAQSTVNRVTDQTSSGAVGVNSTLLYASVPGLPFGGVGDSGMGASHGRDSFETFSHRKPIYTKAAWPELSVLYPPYTRVRKWLLRRLLS